MVDRKKLAVGLVLAATLVGVGAVAAAQAKKPVRAPPPPPPPMVPPPPSPAPLPTSLEVVVETVLDSATKQPISGATVISNTGDTRTADGNGQASFPAVENFMANYIFAASAAGYYGNGYTQGGKAAAGTTGTTIYLRPIPASVLSVIQNFPASPTGYYLIKTNDGSSASEFAFGPYVPPTLQEVESGIANPSSDVAEFWAGKGYSVWLAPATTPSNPSLPPIDWNITPTGSFVQVYSAGPYPEPFGGTAPPPTTAPATYTPPPSSSTPVFRTVSVTYYQVVTTQATVDQTPQHNPIPAGFVVADFNTLQSNWQQNLSTWQSLLNPGPYYFNGAPLALTSSTKLVQVPY